MGLSMKEWEDFEKVAGRGGGDHKVRREGGAQDMVEGLGQCSPNENNEERRWAAGVILVVRGRRKGIDGSVEEAFGKLQLVHPEVIFVADQNHVAKLLKKITIQQINNIIYIETWDKQVILRKCNEWDVQ